MKASKLIILASLAVVFLLLLLPLWIFAQGAIAGSFEMFPRPDDLSARRIIYILLTAGIVICETTIVYVIFRVVRRARGAMKCKNR